MKATLQTLGLILIVFVIQSLATLAEISLSSFALSVPVESNPWTVMLSIYSHASIGHLLSNAVGILILGVIVERVTTNKRFHIFFIITGAIAGISEVLFWSVYGGQGVQVLGASGALFALLGYALFGNSLTDNLFGSIDIGRIGRVLLIMSLAVVVTLVTASQGVALVAHAVGFFVGSICGYHKILHVND